MQFITQCVSNYMVGDPTELSKQDGHLQVVACWTIWYCVFVYMFSTFYILAIYGLYSELLSVHKASM